MESGDAASTPVSTLLKPSEECVSEGHDGTKEQGNELRNQLSAKSGQQTTESKSPDCSLRASHSLNDAPSTHTEVPTKRPLSQPELFEESDEVDCGTLLSESSENSERSIDLSFSE